MLKVCKSWKRGSTDLLDQMINAVFFIVLCAKQRVPRHRLGLGVDHVTVLLLFLAASMAKPPS